jgi:hypothetical protein
LTTFDSKVKPSSPTSTTTVSPSLKSPLSTLLDRGFST